MTLLTSCGQKAENPFYQKWGTPFEAPDFAKIKSAHYLPAFKKGIEEQKAEIAAITQNSEPATFANTIEAYEKSGGLLTKVQDVFFNLTSAHTNEELKKIEKEISPKLSAHADDIMLNAALFTRIKSVYQNADKKALSIEQNTLLTKIYKQFERGGANLPEDKKEAFKALNAELAKLNLEFENNVLEATNAFQLFVSDKAALTGLSEAQLEAAALAAKEAGKEGQYLFTLHKPSLIPFLQYADNRDLRKKMLMGYANMCTETFDNRGIASKMAKLRVERAKLLGYKNHAAYIMEPNMAKTPETVRDFLNKAWKPALKAAHKETKALQQLIYKEGKKFKLEAWDWWYYTEKLKKAKYDLSENDTRPYFQLEKVREGAFLLAKKLFGITFTELADMPKYHEDVKVFQVREADGKHIGVFYVDYFPRASKRGGAWMNSLRKQSGWLNERPTDPIIMNVSNFTKPTESAPSLLSIDEVETLFHEFGHALHGLLSRCQYSYLSGTATPRDFVEFPSQVMENWAMHPEILKLYAKHYQTGETIPEELVQKIDRAAKFNQGFTTVEYMSAALLDLDWHTLTEAIEHDAEDFEKQSMERIQLPSEIIVRYKTPYFRHIFAGGYSAGYYSYLWSQLLDADVFGAFQETNILSTKVASRLREQILEKGGSQDAMTLFQNFRGRAPQPSFLFKRKGLQE